VYQWSAPERHVVDLPAQFLNWHIQHKQSGDTMQEVCQFKISRQNDFPAVQTKGPTSTVGPLTMLLYFQKA
jgi:hypothetical protein